MITDVVAGGHYTILSAAVTNICPDGGGGGGYIHSHGCVVRKLTGCPSSDRIRRITHASFVFTNSAPSFASAAEVATILSIAHVITILPFNWIGLPSCVMLPSGQDYFVF